MNDLREAPAAHDGQRQCFVAMPISTPPSSIGAYRDDNDHFTHVLKHLFEPAIKRAGMLPVPPLTTGANLVHADIVDKIVKSDLVLCDMSTLNPNVFFEMGLRTALNQPLCFVVDSLTVANIPFDAGIVNYHVYRSELAPWTLDAEIDALSQHIRTSVSQSKEGNALWRYFGLRAQFGAEGPKSSGGKDDKLDYLALEVEGMRRKLDGVLTALTPASSELRIRTTLSTPDEISEEQMTVALPTIDPTRVTTEQLVSLAKQLRGRLERAKTRPEEAAIEKSIEQIERALNTRDTGKASLI